MSLNIASYGTHAVNVGYQLLQIALCKQIHIVGSLDLGQLCTKDDGHETNVLDGVSLRQSTVKSNEFHKILRCIQVNGGTAG